jgi:hypothetical protein
MNRAERRSAPFRAPLLPEELDDGPGMVMMLADYRPSPFGGWVASLAPEGAGLAKEAHFPDAHAAYHGVLDILADLEEVLGLPFATLHTLDGDPRAWERIAIAEGFISCIC